MISQLTISNLDRLYSRRPLLRSRPGDSLRGPPRSVFWLPLQSERRCGVQAVALVEMPNLWLQDFSFFIVLWSRDRVHLHWFIITCNSGEYQINLVMIRISITLTLTLSSLMFPAKAYPEAWCRHEGAQYQVGLSVPTPGCNSCLCGPRGIIVCTLKTCLNGKQMVKWAIWGLS